MQYRKEADLLDFYKRCTYFEMWPNGAALNRHRDYKLLEFFVSIIYSNPPEKQVGVRVEAPC